MTQFDLNGFTSNGKLDIGALESWLWEAACKIRGDVDAPKYKEYILPLIFLKRLSDVYDDEVAKLENGYGSRDAVEAILKADHSLVRFYMPPEARWGEVAKRSTGLGEYLTTAVRLIAKENPKLQGVIDIVDFNATASGQRIVSDDKLRALVNVLGDKRYRLGLKDVEPDILGRAYEYLLRKFAEGSGSSAGEFYTPREVAVLMAMILDPKPGELVYDPTCGSGGLLIKCHLRFREKFDDDPKIAPLKFFGQEINHTTFAMAKMNAFIHDMEAEFRLGDTMVRPAFLNPDSSLMRFDIVTANPMWNQEFDQAIYESDAYGRFLFGFPKPRADWGWIQHMFASLVDEGRMAVVLDTGVTSRGSGNPSLNVEREIRKAFVERDVIEMVILLPGNIFYNTPSQGVILVINKKKVHRGELMLINASKMFEKRGANNCLTDKGLQDIHTIFNDWKEEEGISKIVPNGELAKNDYNISPLKHILDNGISEILELDDAISSLRDAEEKRELAEKKMNSILSMLGL